ncbi:MAG: hypothetical protein KBD76_00690 [Bacteriovorax sp.]|nr:hypothetical protein [Bacteriovorax sp.]
MKIILFILFLINVSFAGQTKLDREDSSEQKENILSETYQLSILKTAHFLNKIGYNTLEEFSSERFSSLTDREFALYKKKFTQFALDNSYPAFIQLAQNSNYWNINKRFKNSSSALILVFINTFEEKIFTEEEIAVLWLMHHTDRLQNTQRTKFNFSASVANLTGARKNKKRMNYETAENLIEKLGKTVKSPSLSDINDLSNRFYAYSEDLQFSENKVTFQNKLILNLPVFTPEEIKTQYPNELSDDRDGLSGNVLFKRNFLEGLDAIHHYHQIINDQNYAVIDKNNKTLSLYNQAQLLSTISYSLNLDDRKNIGGAGIYYIENRHNLYNKDLSFFDVLKNDLDLEDGDRVYILPSNPSEHNFAINSYTLTFNSLTKKKNYQSFNYSGKDNYFIKTRFKINKNYTYFKQAFMQSLEDEKENLMKLYNMDSDTYNQLARFSYGVLAVETKFGESKKYRIKEALPVVVSIAKGNGLDQAQNSQGPTQIKNIPQKIVDFYHLEKSDLHDPKNAAVATLGFAFEILQDLKRISNLHSGINNQNLYDFLYKIYQGKRKEITKGTAKLEISNDPNKKTKFQIMTDAYSELTIIDQF